ncbi:MAG: hypothetical protein KKB79_00630 [Nanoarchaeota archaeon]|nr:hypothetical protein [Nanoarchaeota archaeon]
MVLKDLRNIGNVIGYNFLKVYKVASGDGGIRPELAFDNLHLKPGRVKGEIFPLSENDHIVGRILASSTPIPEGHLQLSFPTREDGMNIGSYYHTNTRRTKEGDLLSYPTCVLKLEDCVYHGTLRRSHQKHLFFFPEISPSRSLKEITKDQEILEASPRRELDERIDEVRDLGRRELERDLITIPARVTYYLDSTETIDFDFCVEGARFDKLEGNFSNRTDGEIFREGDPVEIRMEYTFSKDSPTERYQGKKVNVSMSCLYNQGGFNTIVINNARVGRRSLYGESKSSILTRIGRDFERVRGTGIKSGN